MQEIAPKVKELQKQHKGDRETLEHRDDEALQGEQRQPDLRVPAAAAAAAGVLRAVHRHPRVRADDRGRLRAVTAQLLDQGGAAPRSSAPRSARPSTARRTVLAEPRTPTAPTVRIVARSSWSSCMGATTFWTQRQMIARAGTTDPQQVMVQKFLLYVLPLSFAVSGVFFPIGVLLYWVTTNVWSMGQQAYVIKRMPRRSNRATPGKTAARGQGRQGRRRPRHRPSSRHRSRADSSGGHRRQPAAAPAPPRGAPSRAGRQPPTRRASRKNKKSRRPALACASAAAPSRPTAAHPSTRAARLTAPRPTPPPSPRAARTCSSARATSPATTSSACSTSPTSTATSTWTSRASAPSSRSSATGLDALVGPNGQVLEACRS